jgi:hypothetical protein
MRTINILEAPLRNDKNNPKVVVLPLPLPLLVERALLKLGHDVSLARRRRHISQASLAERVGALRCHQT